MKNGNRRLGEIALEIVKKDRPLHSLLEEAGELGSLLQDHATFRIDPSHDIALGETVTGSGLAISPTQAAMCVREPVRTAAFIRGAAQAIRERSGAYRRPLRVLYSGCGPYAPLVVPLMSLFPSRAVRFTLLDIHQPSLDSSMAVIEALGFSGHVSGYLREDASRYTFPDHQIPDIIISETMNACLAKEPLVTIACRLLSQAPNAVMLPSRVFIDACLMDQAKEFAFIDPDAIGEHPEPQRDRVLLGRVFELNADNARSWAAMPGDRLPAAQITLPSPLEDRYQAMLLTRVQVHADVVLGDYDSSLTCPRPISVGRLLKSHDILQFHYRLGSDPGLVYDVVSPG